MRELRQATLQAPHGVHTPLSTETVIFVASYCKASLRISKQPTRMMVLVVDGKRLSNFGNGLGIPESPTGTRGCCQAPYL